MNKKRKNQDSTVSPDTHCSKRTKCDDEKPPVRWAELPCIAVEKIYSYLSREEQRNMSMVCRNWNAEYSSPSLWRKFEFHIPEHDVNLEIYPEVQFARKYGDMFHHVEIVWPLMVEFRHTELIWKQIKLFLEALSSHSQLETVKFLHMRKYDLHLDTTISDVQLTIKNFFLSQHQLKTVEFRNAYFEESEAAELLRLIFHKNSKRLQNICLVDDFEDYYFDDDGFEGDDFEGDDFDDVDRRHDFDEGEITENVGNEAIFESLLNIKTLQLNYSRFFENIMITFYEYSQNSDSRRMKGNLELIEIFCDDSQSISYQGIPPECWKLFTKICPSLRINLTLQIEAQIGSSIDFFIVANMPLKVLIFKWHWCQDDSEAEIGVLLRHLQSSGTNEYLEDLSIVWPSNMNNLAIDLANFFPTSKKLRNVNFSIVNQTESFDSVFSPWIENHSTSIQTLSVSDRNIRAIWKN